MIVLWLVAWAIAGGPAVRGWWIATLIVCLWMSAVAAGARLAARAS